MVRKWLRSRQCSLALRARQIEPRTDTGGIPIVWLFAQICGMTITTQGEYYLARAEVDKPPEGDYAALVSYHDRSAEASRADERSMMLLDEAPMTPASGTSEAPVADDQSDSSGATSDSAPGAPVPPEEEGTKEAPAPRRDGIDLLLALFDRLGVMLPLLGVLAVGAWVSYLGAICVTTALLRRSPAAQNFFVDLLIAMQWPGISILITIGVGIALISLLQLLLWPRGRTWRWFARHLGRPVAWATTVLWTTAAFVEAYLVGWGFEFWAQPYYIALRAALGLTPTPDGLLAASVMVAPVIALLPEWCARFGLSRLVRAWRDAPPPPPARTEVEQGTP